MHALGFLLGILVPGTCGFGQMATQSQVDMDVYGCLFELLLCDGLVPCPECLWLKVSWNWLELPNDPQWINSTENDFWKSNTYSNPAFTFTLVAG